MVTIKAFEFAYVGLFPVVDFSLILTELCGPGTVFIQDFGHYKPEQYFSPGRS